MNPTDERDLLAALGLIGPDPEPQDAGPPDFDGGVRAPAPISTDPVTDHDQWLIDLLEQSSSGGGGEW